MKANTIIDITASGDYSMAREYNTLKDVHNEAQRLMRLTKKELTALSADNVFDLFEAAGKYIPIQAEQFASQLGIEGMTEIRVVCFKKKDGRLGDCSAKGRIRIGFKAFFISRFDDILIIILHELCHLKHHNHSVEFWRLFEQYIKDVGLVPNDYDGWNRSLIGCEDHPYMYNTPWKLSDHPQKYQIVEKKIRSIDSFHGEWIIFYH